MGMTSSANLAYGYHLGSGDDFKAAERDEYGGPNLPWLPEDDDSEGFASEVEDRLLAAVGFTEEWTPGAAERGYYDRKRAAEKASGVDLDYSGHADYSGWVLIAKGSDVSVDWAEVMTLDMAELTNSPAVEGWDAKLVAALTALGITPTQDGPKWLVYPSYG